MALHVNCLADTTLPVRFYRNCNTLAPELEGRLPFAAYPPEDTSFLTTRLWDAHAPYWRNNKTKAAAEPRDKSKDAELVAKINRIAKMAEDAPVISSENAPSREETQFVQVRHGPLRRKGKWTRYPDNV